MNYRLVMLCVLTCFLVYFSTAGAYLKAEDSMDGKALFENKCSKCHPLSTALSQTKDLEKWQATALRMSQKRNSDITEEQAQTIAEYLSSKGSK